MEANRAAPDAVIWVRCSHEFNSLFLQAEALRALFRDSLGVSAEVWAEDRGDRRALLRALRRRIPIFWQYGGFDAFLAAVGVFHSPFLVYHNVTPASFFWRTDPLVAIRALAGYAQVWLLRRRKWIAVSEFNAESLRALGCRKVQIWTNIVPLRARRNSAKAPAPQVIFVGRIVENKNCISLLLSMEKVAESLAAPLRLIVVGSGKRRAAFVKRFERVLARLNGEGRVQCDWYTSNLEPEALEELYAASWLFVSASLHEGFGLPQCEAILQGTPAVYFSCGGTERVLRNVGVVPERTGEAMARTVAGLLKSERDRERLLATQTPMVLGLTHEALLQQGRENLSVWLQSAASARS